MGGYRQRRYGTPPSWRDTFALGVPHEPPYKSQGEAQIGRFLRRYDIPFIYELPVRVYDGGRHRFWRPDFTLVTAGLLIEYAGVVNDERYARRTRRKELIYIDNGIASLFVYPNDLARRDWDEWLLEHIAMTAPYPPAVRAWQPADHSERELQRLYRLSMGLK